MRPDCIVYTLKQEQELKQEVCVLPSSLLENCFNKLRSFHYEANCGDRFFFMAGFKLQGTEIRIRAGCLAAALLCTFVTTVSVYRLQAVHRTENK